MDSAETITKRISIEQCRELLGKGEELLSDQQVERLRDALYMLGDNVLDSIFNRSNVSPNHE